MAMCVPGATAVTDMEITFPKFMRGVFQYACVIMFTIIIINRKIVTITRGYLNQQVFVYFYHNLKFLLFSLPLSAQFIRKKRMASKIVIHSIHSSPPGSRGGIVVMVCAPLEFSSWT